MIDFELPTPIERQMQLLGMLGEQVMRPVARYYDEHEGERPWDYINMIWQTVRAQGGRTLAVGTEKNESGDKKPRIGNLM
ncbi:acyl-CoA dehydrogenase, partial [Kouleothrix aurantiaca]